MAMGQPNFDSGADVTQSPEKQMAKLRETARSGGTGGGSYAREGLRMETPVSPHSEASHTEEAESQKSGITLELTPDANDKDMEELLGILNARGYAAVMKELDRINNPHLEDDFHRLLVQYKRDGHPINGLTSDDPMHKALGFVLFEISITVSDGAKQQSVQDVFNAMEQFYRSFIAFQSLPNPIFFKDWRKRKTIHKEYFVMELAVAGGGEEAIFYMAVPRARREIFEKQVLSIFPRARVNEHKDDYNIFNQFGAVAISEAQYVRAAPLPLRHADGFPSDPLNVTLAAFSRITKEGEGAALQIVVMSAGDYHKNKIRNAYDDIQKGDKPSKVYEKYKFSSKDPLWRRGAPEAVKTVQDALKEKKKDEAKSADSIASEQISKKLKSPIVGVNMRLVASARTEERAQAILSDLEATFGQYEEPQGNRLKFDRKKSKREQRDLLRKYIFRLPDRGINDSRFPPWYERPFKKGVLRMNYAELAALFHLTIAGGSTSREVKLTSAKLAPAPPNLPKDGILLGRNRYSGSVTDIHFSPIDRLRHLYVIGQTGVGKTTFLKNMIIQDIENGEGVCFIDPHGPDVLDILSRIPKHRYDDLIYFDPAYTERPMGLNMLEYDPRFPEQKTFVVDEMFKIFKKLYGDVPEAFGPIFEQYFRNAAALVVEDPETGSTLMDISRVLADEEFRHLKLSRCRNPVVSHFWEDIAENVRGEGDLRNIVPYITSKFDIFIANEIMRPIVGQQRSAFNFKDIMDNKKILLVNLSKGRLGDVNANLIGLVLVGKMMMTALGRDLSANPPPFYLYLDEFQNITTDTIATILSEARKFKLSMTMAHQYINQLQPRTGVKEAVFGNVGSLVIFRVGVEDAEFLAKQFEPVFSAQDMLHIDNFHAYMKLLADNKPVTPFTIENIPFVAGDSVTLDALRQMSYQRFGRPRDAVEAEIREKYSRGR